MDSMHAIHPGSACLCIPPFKEILEKWEVPPINEVTKKLERLNRAMIKQADEMEKSK